MAKSKKLKLPISKLTRRDAVAHRLCETGDELGALADAAKAAADRAGAAIDDVLAFIDESNKRIAAMETSAAKASASK